MPTRAPVKIEFPLGDVGARISGASRARKGLFAQVFLTALEQLYSAGTYVRNVAFDVGVLRAQHVSLPVISVGNIVVGGAGKTPFARWLALDLAARGRKVAIIHGGYGSDEPELHRRWLPDALVYEQKDRVAASAAAARGGADVIVLDDAFQHRRIARNLDIVLMPAETASTHLLPRGPMREAAGGLARADIIVVTRKTATASEALAIAKRLGSQFNKPTAVAALRPGTLRPAVASAATKPDRGIIVTAIARPDLLVEQVAELIEPTRALAYPDHHVYTDADARYILEKAEGQPIITTEKDAVKLLTVMDPANVWIVDQQVAIEEGGAVLTTLLEAAIATH